MIYILGALLFLCGVFYPFILYQLRKYEKQEKDRIYYEEKSGKGSNSYAFYSFFSNWFLTRYYVRKLKKRMDQYSPGNEKKAAAKTMRVFFLSWGSGIFVILCILLFTPRFTTTIILLSGIYFFNMATIYRVVSREEDRLREEFLYFLSDVRHNYRAKGMIEEAIEDSIRDQTPEDMKAHAVYLVDTVTDEDMDEKVKNYSDNVPHNYLKEFLALCVTVIRFGDHTVNGQSLFLTGIRNLKRFLNAERLRKKQQNHMFAGYSFIIAAPIFSLPLLSAWATGTMPVLDKYYNGAYGLVTAVLAFLTTVLIFNLNIRLQEGYQFQDRDHAFLTQILRVRPVYRFVREMQQKNEGKRLRMEQLIRESGENMTTEQLLLKRMLFPAFTFLAANLLFFAIHANTRYYCLHQMNGLKELTSAITQEQEKGILDTVQKYVNQYAGETPDPGKLTEQLQQEEEIPFDYMVESCVNEIDRRIRKYNNAYYRWYELLIAIFIGAIGYFYPYGILLYQKYLVKGVMIEEVMQFQSVISMLAPIPQMTPEIILGWLENFALIFRQSITRCLDSLTSSEDEALEELKETEQFEPFQRLIENLQACDKVGVEAAFDELESERNYYLEERKQEGQISLDNHAAIGAFFAAIPLLFVVVGYLFLPFIIESIYQLVIQYGDVKGMM